MRSYRKRITPAVRSELKRADQAADPTTKFTHLERAHVLGQHSTYWHTRVHVSMLLWGIKNKSAREIAGQLFRVLGAISKTPLGIIPTGNTGGANVSPFRKMPIEPELLKLIQAAR